MNPCLAGEGRKPFARIGKCICHYHISDKLGKSETKAHDPDERKQKSLLFLNSVGVICNLISWR